MQDKLEAQLTTEREMLTRLQEQLHHESELLRSADYDSLITLQNEKFASIERLQNLERDRAAMIEGDENPFRFYATHDPGGKLASLFSNNLKIAERCRDANLANGITMSRCERFFSQSLQILSGQQKESSVYDMAGHASASLTNRSFGQV